MLAVYIDVESQYLPKEFKIEIDKTDRSWERKYYLHFTDGGSGRLNDLPEVIQRVCDSQK